MISLSEALGWLNHLDKSHLSTKSQLSLTEITNTPRTEIEKDRAIDALIYNTRNLDRPLEYAEVLVNCASIQADRNRLAQARVLLEHAITTYEEEGERLRQAITLWMLATVEYNLLDNRAGYLHASSARTLLEQIVRDPFLSTKGNQLSWLMGRITYMEEDLSATPEEAYKWLTFFEKDQKGHLQPAALQLVDAVYYNLKEKLFNKVYQLLETLLEITRSSKDAMEKAEALAFCGLINSQMGNTREAVNYLRNAASLYLPESHQQMAVNWMLGITLFTLPFESDRAIALCNECIKLADQLKDRAEHRNRPSEMNWYKDIAKVMRKVLEKKVRTLVSNIRS